MKNKLMLNKVIRKNASVLSRYIVMVSFLLVMPLLADAAIIYVDKDNACHGNGSTATPYCSIQRAFSDPGYGQLEQTD